jgi:hypothetical protein
MNATTRSERLEATLRAIREGRAYLETYIGRRKVTGYDDRTGDAVTGSGWDQRTFLVTLEAIKIA